MDYQKYFFPEGIKYLTSSPEARFASFEINGERRLYPVDVYDGEMWDVEKVQKAIELLQDSLKYVTQGDVERYNEELEAERIAKYYEPPKKTERKKRKGFVYLMKSENGHYKVGFSIDPNKRVRDIQKNSPFKIKLLHSIETNDMVPLEKHFHEKFAINRGNGEWFQLTESQIQYMFDYQEV